MTALLECIAHLQHFFKHVAKYFRHHSLETCYAYTVMLALLVGAYTHTYTTDCISVHYLYIIHDAVTLPCKLLHKQSRLNVKEHCFVAIACIN